MAEPRRRMLRLLSLLQTGRAWPGGELAGRLEISLRTLRRDIDELRQLGYPVRTRPGPGGHYQLVAGTAMPPLLFEDDEAVAVAVGLRMADQAGPVPVGDREEAAGRALSKLEQVLPGRLRERVAAVHRATETVPAADPSVPTGLLGLIGAAAGRREYLTFSYPGSGPTPSTRFVEPYRQVLTRRRWYLLAWDVDRSDWRTFRIDRLTDAFPTGRYFPPRPLPAASAAAYLDAALTARRHCVVITLRAPVDQLAPRLRQRDAELAPLDDRSCRLTTWVDSYEWLAVTTLLLGIDFTVDPVDGADTEAFTNYCRQLRDRLDHAVNPGTDAGCT